MGVKIRFCEYATQHADGTFTVLRAGIDHWSSAVPFGLQLWAFVDLDAGEIPTGKHEFALVCVDAAKVQLSECKGEIQVLDAALPQRIFLPIAGMVTKHGKLVAVFTAAGKVYSAEIDVRAPVLAH